MGAQISPETFSGVVYQVRRSVDVMTCVEVRDLLPSEVLVLTNHPPADEGFIKSGRRKPRGTQRIMDTRRIGR